MARGPLDVARRRSAIDAAREALDGFGAALASVSGAELGELMETVDDLATRASAARATIATETVRRGEVAGSGLPVWLREHARSLRQGGAASVARLALAVAETGRRGLDDTGPAPDSPVGLVWAAVERGRLDAGTGCAVLRETTRLEPLVRPEALPTVTSALVDLVGEWGPTMMRRLRARLVADHGRSGALDDLQRRLGRAARLSMPHVESADLTEYQLWMTPEQAATLEAAIGPLSAPRPDPETGERDLRPAGQRRVEALTEACRRSAALDASSDTACAATLHVTIDLDDLRAGTRAGEVIGSTADGTLLAPDTLRRLACDAALVPHVLGTVGEPLGLGRVARLFTRAQRRHLWLRDRGCTYPGCTAPPSWAKAHHVRHWVDGGGTDVTNAALLCQRHHTLVHDRRLVAEVRRRPDDRGRHVVWDLADGSYDVARRTWHVDDRADPDHDDLDPEVEQWWAELTEDDWVSPAA